MTGHEVKLLPLVCSQTYQRQGRFGMQLSD